MAGAWVEVLGPGDSAPSWARTDEAGRFDAVTLAGSVAVQVDSAPFPYLMPVPHGRVLRTDVAVGLEVFPWPMIELERGTVLRGTVVDDAGQSVDGGIRVEARWVRRDGRAHSDGVATATTGADGGFVVGPLAPLVEIDLAAHRPGDRAGVPIRVGPPLDAQPIRVTLSHPGARFEPAGRVVDATGRPVAGALIQFRVADPALSVHGPRAGRRIAADGFDAVVSDDQGRYTAAGRLDGRHRYLVAAEAAGCESGRTKATTPHLAGGLVLRFPDLVVDRHAESPVVVGRVVGTDGRPIADVAVTDGARHKCVTNNAGWFRLEQVGEGGAAFLFARRAGFRFAGRPIRFEQGDADRSIHIILTRTDEPATDPRMATRAGEPVARALATAVARALVVDPLIERILSRHDPVVTTNLLEQLARVEPTRVLGWLKADTIVNSRSADGLRRVAARSLAAVGFDRAGPVLASIGDPVVRCLATLDSMTAAATLDRAQRREWLERTEREARSIEDLGRRVVVLARVAGGWLDLGDRDHAQLVLDDAQAMAETLPRATTGAKAWSALIEPLARINPDLARERLQALIDPADRDRCRLMIALRSGRGDPEGAARTFRQIRDPQLRLRATPELCHLLAPIRPALARTLADAIRATNPAESAYALGMVAAGLAPTDRPAAEATLRETFDRLETAVTSGTSTLAEGPVEPAAVAALLLPVIERIDPALVTEYFWETVALHTSRDHASPRSSALLALLIDRYDRTAARLIFDPDRTRPTMVATSDLPALLLATVQFAPDIAFGWVETPAETAASDQPRVEWVAAWTLTAADRWNHAALEYYGVWIPPDLPAIP